VTSVVGRGTTFRVRIPLTLAIVGALIVESGGVRYALPQADLVELVRLRRGGPEVERVGGAPVFRLRDRLLPLVFLHEALGAPVSDSGEGDRSIVVLHGNGHTFGLVVDAVHGTEEIVVKPLSAHVGDLNLYSGATVLGDGAVVLIVDVASVGEHVQSVQRGADAMEGQDGSAQDGESGPEVLVVRAGTRRVAVPLDEVVRLEEFRRDQVEEVGGRLAVQYRSGVLPLVELGDVLGAPPADYQDGSAGRLQVLVAAVGQQGVGLVVAEVEDVAVASRLQASNGGFSRGTAVVAGLLTDVLDLPTVARAALPSYWEEAA
jgi:two-component system chemotaxis sensor kinase CheA